VPGIFGATIMGDGSRGVILDMAPLVRKVAALRQTVIDEQGQEVPDAGRRTGSERRQPLVMVVDDSITMRKVTSRVLERNTSKFSPRRTASTPSRSSRTASRT
jgi:chemosensory pili system protein ChpA (sensor histidine kinase/response regulator)